MKYLLLFIFFASTPHLSTAQTYVDYYRQGVQSYQSGDMDTFLVATQKADSIRPNHPTILYNLAAAYSLNNDEEMTFKTLKKRISFLADSSFFGDEDFSTVLTEEKRTEFRTLINSSTSTISTSEKVFSIDEEGFHPEGITYDKKRQKLIIGDVHNGKIVSYSLLGEGKELIINLAEHGYWGAFGITMDNVQENILWATTAVVPEFSGYNAEIEGRSALLKIDINNGTVIQAFEVEGEGASVFGDLTQAKDGSIYITDSVQPIIYKLPSGGDDLILFMKNDSWWNLQGLALSKDESKLYVSDYILGVLEVYISNKVAKRYYASDKNTSTRGTDGMYRIDDSLVLIQNGTNPSRISYLPLQISNTDSKSDIIVLDQAIPDISEPTLGVVIGKELYFIANSPWAFYNEDQAPKLEEWPMINIYKLSLK